MALSIYLCPKRGSAAQSWDGAKVMALCTDSAQNWEGNTGCDNTVHSGPQHRQNSRHWTWLCHKMLWIMATSDIVTWKFEMPGLTGSMMPYFQTACGCLQQLWFLTMQPELCQGFSESWRIILNHGESSFLFQNQEALSNGLPLVFAPSLPAAKVDHTLRTQMKSGHVIILQWNKHLKYMPFAERVILWSKTLQTYMM